MIIRIGLQAGGIGIDTSDLKSLKRDSKLIASLSDYDKDLVMKKKDELFGKVKPQPVNVEPAADSAGVDE